MSQCKALTKAGRRCARGATWDGYCETHAIPVRRWYADARATRAARDSAREDEASSVCALGYAILRGEGLEECASRARMAMAATEAAEAEYARVQAARPREEE